MSKRKPKTSTVWIVPPDIKPDLSDPRCIAWMKGNPDCQQVTVKHDADTKVKPVEKSPWFRRLNLWIVIAIVIVLTACQVGRTTYTVTLIDGTTDTVTADVMRKRGDTYEFYDTDRNGLKTTRTFVYYAPADSILKIEPQPQAQ